MGGLQADLLGGSGGADAPPSNQVELRLLAGPGQYLAQVCMFLPLHLALFPPVIRSWAGTCGRGLRETDAEIFGNSNPEVVRDQRFRTPATSPELCAMIEFANQVEHSTSHFGKMTHHTQSDFLRTRTTRKIHRRLN